MTIEEFLTTLLLAWGIDKGKKYLDKVSNYVKKGVKKHGIRRRIRL